MNRIKAGIIGGAGYTAGELLRTLIHHPQVEISFIQSDSNAGQPVSLIHRDLFYEEELYFSSDDSTGADVIFLCKGHGESARILQKNNFNDSIRLIDLSQDFRLRGSFPELQRKTGDFIYGLPELNRDQIRKAWNIANPGCFATCIQLGLLPLAGRKLINEDVHISAITGSTGAGQQPTSTSHFSWRNNNMSVYKAFRHQHLHEIRQSLEDLQGTLDHQLYFIPYRGNFTRGIIATMYLPLELSIEEVNYLYSDYYLEHPFVKISPENIDLKQVVNTNYGLLYLEKQANQLMIISMVDNLLKGASGQAVQNMNLMFGLEETMGLKLKGTAF